MRNNHISMQQQQLITEIQQIGLDFAEDLMGPNYLEDMMAMIPENYSQRGIRFFWDIIKRDKKKLDPVEGDGRQIMCQDLPGSTPKSTAKSRARIRSPTDLAPMRVRELKVGTTSRGRFILGKVGDPEAHITSPHVNSGHRAPFDLSLIS
eukprot:GHVU01092350.1.p1 GENE.GHVU01092350.1~~GHVU01092350.1.p1  ORF type:complete len:150 (+),score=9.20 GHVU01092350.1:40-489(+)